MNELQIPNVPLADKFFPCCYWGLVELIAQYEFGVPNIKRAWFNHSFVYTPSLGGGVGLAENNIDLNVALSSSGYADDNVARKVRDYFGLTLEVVEYTEYEGLVAAIKDRLRHREITISSFNLGFQRTRREYGKVFLLHTIGLVGFDDARKMLLVTDQFQGRLELPLRDFEACFHYLRKMGTPFLLTNCRRDERLVDSAKAHDDLRKDLEAALENLRSTHPRLGLGGLRWAAKDVLTASLTLDRPFALPGMWRLGKDRACVAEATVHWPDRVDRQLLVRLRRRLKALFELWFGIDMTIEASIQLSGAKRGHLIAEMLASAIPGEEEATDMLEEVWEQVR